MVLSSSLVSRSTTPHTALGPQPGGSLAPWRTIRFRSGGSEASSGLLRPIVVGARSQQRRQGTVRPASWSARGDDVLAKPSRTS